MDVAVIFDPAFDGAVGKAVWIIETAANKTWFGAQPDLTPNSAVFSAANNMNIEASVLQMICNAQEHHPAWDRIEVIGTSLTPAIVAKFQGECNISPTPEGFRLQRL